MEPVQLKNKANNGVAIPQTGVVVFLDALGTKAVWSRKEPSKFIKSWNNLIESFKVQKEIYDKLFDHESYKNNSKFGKLNIRSFSDTIILTLSHDIDDSQKIYPLNLFDLNIGLILLQGIYSAIINKGIYLRGVISFGEFYISDQIIIGPAVDEASEWYEKPE